MGRDCGRSQSPQRGAVAHPRRDEFVQNGEGIRKSKAIPEVDNKSISEGGCVPIKGPSASRRAVEMAAERCWGKDKDRARVSPGLTQLLPAHGPSLLSTAHSFFWPQLFNRTLLFPAVKQSLNSRLGTQMAS